MKFFRVKCLLNLILHVHPYSYIDKVYITFLDFIVSSLSKIILPVFNYQLFKYYTTLGL